MEDLQKQGLKNDCSCEPDKVLIFPCSGGSNVGQLSNAAAVKLTEEGKGRLFCLAGLGGHIPHMIESVKGAERIVALDGCSVACSKLTLEHAGFKVTDYLVLTEEGIKKNKDFNLREAEINNIYEKVLNKLSQEVSSSS